MVTGVALTADCTRLITVSGDTCIFVWELPAALVRTMQAGLQQGHPTLQPCQRESNVTEKQKQPSATPTPLQGTCTQAWAEDYSAAVEASGGTPAGIQDIDPGTLKKKTIYSSE